MTADLDWHEEEPDSDDEEYRNIPHVTRKEHVEDFAANYHAGQHATFLGPSGRGKTKLMGQLLIRTLQKHRDIEGRILHGKIKGRDKTIMDMERRGFPITDKAELTAIQKLRHRNRLGYIVRPLVKPQGSPDSDEDLTARENDLLRRVFRKTIYRSYHAPKKHPVIVVVDEAHQAHNDLRLRSACEGPLMRGRPVCGMWSLIQRGRHVSMMAYDQAEYVWIFWDPDIDNQRRYSEIGGVDARLLRRLSRNLKTFTAKDGSTYSECIFFRRSGNYLAIVGT